MCINKKVVAGLAVAGFAIFAFAPDLIGAALPFLIIAACPLSMLVMMRAMSGGESKSRSAKGESSLDATADIDAELAGLRAEVDRLRGDRPLDASPELR